MGKRFLLPDGNVQIAFSGGRTSAYMLHQILEANGDLPDRVEVAFQNTGREMPQTLDFVQRCSEEWAVPITWLEYTPEAPRFKVVDRGTASEDGEPFEALIRKRRFLPNQVARFCTAELKVHCSTRYARSLGWERWVKAVGIRADESRRIPKSQPKERFSLWHPLNDAGVSKRHVSEFWGKQSFDLELPTRNGATWLGNCDGCFLKSEANLAALARDYPDRHAWWERMEALARTLSTGSGGTFRPNYTRSELREFVERQGDWIFNDEAYLCQADGGECIG